MDNPLPAILLEFDCNKVFDECTIRRLKFDVAMNALVTQDSRVTRKLLFGSWPGLREWFTLRYGLGKLRACLLASKVNFTSGVSLPPDAVVFVRSTGVVVVVASAAQRRIVKLERHIFAKHSQNCAVKGYHLFRQAGLLDQSPVVIEYGQTDSGIYYTVFSLLPNSPPFFRSRFQNRWPHTLRRYVLPILEQFHLANGLTLIDGPEWSARIILKLSSRILTPQMEGFWNQTISELSVDRTVTPIGYISGDLQPQNIHFANGTPSILDWSCEETAAILIDFFCEIFYGAMRSPDDRSSKEFWEYLGKRRELISCSRKFRLMVQIWMEWIDSWLGRKINPVSMNLHLRGMCLDWLVTMKHPWLPDGRLWRNFFPDYFLAYFDDSDLMLASEVESPPPLAT